MGDINTEFLKSAVNPYDRTELTALSALNLAYIGDAVFEVLVRTEVLGRAKTSGSNLHDSSKALVRANAQSQMYYILYDKLTAEEAAVLKRGRNAKSCSKAKNASVSEYRHATGLEALFGYLYLKGETDRLMELFRICSDSLKEHTGEENK